MNKFANDSLPITTCFFMLELIELFFNLFLFLCLFLLPAPTHHEIEKLYLIIPQNIHNQLLIISLSFTNKQLEPN